MLVVRRLPLKYLLVVSIAGQWRSVYANARRWLFVARICFKPGCLSARNIGYILYHANVIIAPYRPAVGLVFKSDRLMRRFVCLFVCSLRAGVQPTLDPSAETFWIGPMHQPRERRGVDRCVWCARYVGWRRESIGLSSLSGISKRDPSRCDLLSD